MDLFDPTSQVLEGAGVVDHVRRDPQALLASRLGGDPGAGVVLGLPAVAQHPLDVELLEHVDDHHSVELPGTAGLR